MSSNVETKKGVGLHQNDGRGDLMIERWFTTPGVHPFDEIEWERRDARIIGAKGEVVFEQKDVEVPRFWSQNATNIVASKYFRGPLGTPQRESSVKQLIGRVVKTITGWGLKDGYFASEDEAETFAAELTHLLVHQKAAFNSPVYFNIGVPGEKQQAAACFILSIEDTMESILDWYRTEGLIFKGGSGSGVNLSKLRSSKERLSSGGMASGPVSFMRGADAIAGTIKSGGKSRRAAKMIVLNVDHPDIEEFIWCKAKEERKAYTLAEAGYDLSLDGEAWISIQYQNANNSVRVTDDFMRAVLEDKDWPLKAVTTGEVLKTVKARDLMRQIAQAAWECADPGIQYDTTINDWHTTPSFGRITASNPCAEYHSNDDTSCNLSSVNLLKFLNEDGKFDVESFKHAVATMILAQEIIVGNASYPTEKIRERTVALRQLGLGYANLGALLMASGLPYDSDEGRALVGAITALMTGHAYATSALIAKKVGPFAGFKKNREPMLRVMRKHRDALGKVDAKLVPPDLYEAAAQAWDEAVRLGELYGYRNAQASVLAPTGTISFMMDCDTTGIEPDLALVKYKTLVGGGVMRIVNQTVPLALKRLGYAPDEIEAIVRYIDEKGAIEGAPHLKLEHLPVFDCAFRPPNGTRSIHYMGHVKMLAAAQPFISGAISKCVTTDTLILTEHGVIPIGQFYDGEIADSFRRLKVELASIDAPQMADLFYYGGVRPTIRLTLADGRVIEGTPNHQVKVANQAGYGWKRLDQITTDDFVAIKLDSDVWAKQNFRIHFHPSGLYGTQKRIVIPKEMSPPLARFIGYYIAEGSMARSNWTLRITNNSDAILDRCLSTTKELFGIDGRIEIDKRNGVKSFVVSSKTLIELFDYLGCRGDSAEKEIPHSILQSTRNVIREFVAGLWLDGYVRSDGTIAICLESEKLIRQLQIVLNNFGIRAKIIKKYNKEYDKYCMELGVHGDDAKRFAELFQLDEPLKVERLGMILNQEKATDAVWSDVVPSFRDQIQGAIRSKHETMKWRKVFDPHTKNLSWQTVRDVYYEYYLPELAEIVENNIHFEPVREISEGCAEVYDFQVPGNHTFIGNGIVNHNTVNLPHDVTPEDVAQVYIEGWKLGLKALAIYRDSSKKVQPLAAAKGEKERREEPRPIRKRLPDERQAVTHKFSVGGQEGYITVGLFGDGAPGEVFLTIAKEGSTVSGLMDVIATETSIALQYGVPLKDLVRKFINTRFEPAGITNNPQIRFATSIIDYVFRWLGLKFLPYEDQVELGLIPRSAAEVEAPAPAGVPEAKLEGDGRVAAPQFDGPPCFECGAIMVRAGSCHACLNCGATRGCS